MATVNSNEAIVASLIPTEFFSRIKYAEVKYKIPNVEPAIREAKDPDFV